MQVIIDFLWTIPSGVLDTFGYLFFFAGAFGEGMPVFGVLVPGQSMAILSGVFVKMDLFSPFGITLIISLGAIIGDYVGYYIGKKYGFPFITKYGKYVNVKEESLSKLSVMAHKHFLKAIILGRFSSFTRCFISFICGVSHIAQRKFLMYTIVSSIIWSALSVLAGYLLGHSYTLVANILGPMFVFGILFMLFMVFGYSYINKRRHVFDRRYLVTLIVSIISLFFFFKTSQDIIHFKPILMLDSFVNMKIDVLSLIPFFSKDLVVGAMTFFNTYFGFPFMILMATALLFFLWYKKRKYHFWILLSGMIGAVSIEIILEGIMRNVDHGFFVRFVNSLSFPASHVTMATIFFFGLWLILRENMQSLWRKILFFAVCFGSILVIALSKLILSSEDFVRILSGLSLGISIITILMLILRVVLSRKPGDRPIALP